MPDDNQAVLECKAVEISKALESTGAFAEMWQAAREKGDAAAAQRMGLPTPPVSPSSPTWQPAPPDSSNERAGPSRNRSMASVPSTSSAASGGGEEQHSDLGLVMNALAEMQAHMRRQDAAQRRLESKLETLLMRGGGGDD